MTEMAAILAVRKKKRSVQRTVTTAPPCLVWTAEHIPHRIQHGEENDQLS